MRADYDDCLRRLLVHEGGYTNDPRDPGGPTNFGITIADYRHYVNPKATAADVKIMRVDEAKAIYKSKYWDAVRGDELPSGLDDVIFDYGVNSGVSRGIKVLQRAVGVPADGKLGDATMQAIAKRDPGALINWICDERLAFLKSLKTWDHFGPGWGKRVAEVRAYALQLAERAKTGADASVPLPTPKPEVQTAGKGVVPQSPATKTVVEHGGKIGTAAGAGVFAWLFAHPKAAFALGAAVAMLGVALAIYLVERQKSKQDAAVPGLTPVPAA